MRGTKHVQKKRERDREVFEDIMYEKKDGVAKITINRPELLNAVRKKTADEMIQALEDAGDDPSVGVVVITGAGDKAFCSGGDVKEMKNCRKEGISFLPKQSMVTFNVLGFKQRLT